MSQLWPRPSYLPPHFAWTLKEVDGNTWCVGGKLLIIRHESETPGACWSDGKGGFLTATELPGPADASLPPGPHEVSDGHPFYAIDDYQHQGACWVVGQAMLRVQPVGFPDRNTPEHAILEALREKTWSFRVPKVYYHGVHASRYYIIFEKLPGDFLDDVWLDMKDEELKGRIFEQVARAVQELSNWRQCSLSSINGAKLPLVDSDLFKHDKGGRSGKRITRNCKQLGIDCEKLVFAHNYMWPPAILVDSHGLVGFIDWEFAGFVPQEWIRTHFYVGHLIAGTRKWPDDKRQEWVWGLDRELIELGFGECVAQWRARFDTKQQNDETDEDVDAGQQ